MTTEANETVELLDQFEMEVGWKGYNQPFPLPFWQSRAFQLCATAFIRRVKRCILSVDKGLGKTGILLSTFEPIANEWDLEHPRSKWSGVILTTKRGMTAYTRDIEKFPEYEGKIQLIYVPQSQQSKSTEVRRDLWRNKQARYFICTYAGLLGDMGFRGSSSNNKGVLVAPQWVMKAEMDMVACDEFHRFFRNRTSNTFQLIHDFFRKIPYFIAMSGSAVSDGPEDLWPALYLCDPKFWSSYWKYVSTWCEVNVTAFGKQIRGPKHDPKKMGGINQNRVALWKQAVSPYLFHVTAEMVSKELPPINNYPLDIIMEPWQKKLHDDLRDRLYAETDEGEFIFAQNTLVKYHLIRTALICPKAIDESYGVGAGIESIADDVEESELRGYALFTPFRKPIPYLRDYLQSRGHRVWCLLGGISLEEQTQYIEEWKASLHDSVRPSCILGTIKYAESWEIPEAHNGYFLGYEWDPEDNDQARKRLRRLISTKPVNIQWARHLEAYDLDFLQMLMDKTDGKRAMFDNWNLRQSLLPK